MAEILNHFFKPTPQLFLALMAISGLITFLSCILRYTPLIPEPEFPLKTPFGKLPFFDGIALYGIIIFLLSSLARGMMVLWDYVL